jgi:hypothetical protein
MFSSMDSGIPPVTLVLKGIEVTYKDSEKVQRVLTGIPSFKTGKTAVGWWDKLKQKVQARPLTLPHHAKWMELATLSLESQLRCAFQITDERIQTVASPRSWIASRMPLDDSWAWCPEIHVKSELCEPGQEGATILIERIS